MSSTPIDSPKTTTPSESVVSRSNQPQQQAPISALLNGRRDDNNNNKTVATFLPTPVTPVAGIPSSKLLRNPFESKSSTITSPIVIDKGRPYTCTECNQTFSRPHNLKSHLTTHSSERPFQCSVCNSYFRRHHDLKRHKKLHTGERPYRCDVCHRSFARLDALNRHSRAEGGTACNNTATKQHPDRHQYQPQRPIVPQLHIAHPASQPLRSIFQNHPRHQHLPPTSPPPPTLTTTPPTATSSTTLNTIPTSKIASSNTTRTLPLPPFKDPWEENNQIRHELAFWKAKAEQADVLQSQLHDLQVENKVLRSIIMDARPDNTLNHG